MPGSTFTASASSDKKRLINIKANSMDPMLFEALNDVIEALTEQPTKILPCLRDVKSDKYLFQSQKNNQDDEDEQPFHSTYKKLYRTPKDFLRKYLAALAMTNGRSELDETSLVSLEKAREGTIRDLYYYLHDVAADTAWPAFCHNRRVWRETFADVHKTLGSRIKSVKILRDGTKMHINWQECGQYGLEPAEGGPKTHIVYRQLNLRAALTDFPDIAGAFTIPGNHSHTKAVLKYKRSSASCIEFFSDEQKTAIYDHWKKHPQTIQNAANTAEQKRVEEEGADSDFGLGAAAAEPGVQVAPPAMDQRGRKRKQPSS